MGDSPVETEGRNRRRNFSWAVTFSCIASMDFLAYFRTSSVAERAVDAFSSIAMTAVACLLAVSAADRSGLLQSIARRARGAPLPAEVETITTTASVDPPAPDTAPATGTVTTEGTTR